MLDPIRKLHDYNAWANGLIFRAAEGVTPVEFTQKDAHSQRSLREILVHVLFAEWVWLQRMNGNSPDAALVSSTMQPEDFPTIADLHQRWFEEELMMRAFLADLTKEKLGETFQYTTTKGQPFQQTYQDVLTHIVLHGMQHRAEAAQILTNLSRSPGDIDFIRYLRQT